jgi:hypothetical protein
MKLGFKIYFENKTVYVPMSALEGETRGEVTVYKTKVEGADVEWIHTAEKNGAFVEMNVSSDSPLGIKRIDSVVCEVGVPGITDHIAVNITGSDKLTAILAANPAEVTTAVLCDALTFEAGESAGVYAGGFAKEWDINGEKCTVSVKKLA